MLRIGEDNVFPLQFAFNSKSFGPKEYLKSVNTPSPEFTRSLEPLRKKILQRFEDISD